MAPGRTSPLICEMRWVAVLVLLSGFSVADAQKPLTG